ncbi:MAG: Glu/Leu/Phe/Val dehydrogenase dimerization domain-containing protein [Pseudomonadota bacterium]
MIFEHPEFGGPGGAHEQVDFAADPESGLRAILAVHNTRRGPALGGLRLWRYASGAEALTDALRLSRGMTYKAALADLPLGGGKSVILLEPEQEKTPALMRAMGAAVERLGGRYIAAEDVGASPADMDLMRERTSHVTGLSSGVGDPSPWTAEGVFLCLKAAVRLKLGRDDLSGVRVTVKGLGSVGARLARRLAAAGAALTLADLREEIAASLAAELGGRVCGPDEAVSAPAEVFAPCALGGDLAGEALERLGAPIICGAANNQLGAPEDGARLAAAGALYCPDYLVNAGGLISVARPAIGMDEPAARHPAPPPRSLRPTSPATPRASGAPTAAIADRLAEARFMIA